MQGAIWRLQRVLGNLQHPVGIVFPAVGGGNGFPSFYKAQFVSSTISHSPPNHLFFIVTMTTSVIKQAGATANIALIFIRPLNYFYMV